METELKQNSTLTALLNLASRDPIAWRADELAAIWRHQLGTPLMSDLGGVSSDAPSCITDWSQGATNRTLADLLKDSSPPIKLLQLVKDFAKRHTSGSDAVLPQDIAVTLYYLAIALAMLRCDCRISDLSHTSLCNGLKWASRQTWLDDPSRALFEELLQRLAAGAERSR